MGLGWVDLLKKDVLPDKWFTVFKESAIPGVVF